MIPPAPFVQISAVAGQKMPRRGLDQFAFGLDVEHAPHFVSFTPFTTRVIVRILVVDPDSQHVVRQQILQGSHRIAPEDQFSVHIGTGNILAHDTHAVLRSQHSGQLLHDFDRLVALERPHRRCVVDQCIPFDLKHRNLPFDHNRFDLLRRFLHRHRHLGCFSRFYLYLLDYILVRHM